MSLKIPDSCESSLKLGFWKQFTTADIIYLQSDFLWIIPKIRILKAIHNTPPGAMNLTVLWIIPKIRILKAIHNREANPYFEVHLWIIPKIRILKAIHNTWDDLDKSGHLWIIPKIRILKAIHNKATTFKCDAAPVNHP